MNLPIQMKIFNKAKHRHVSPPKFGHNFYLVKLVLEVKASICSPFRENLRLYCRKFKISILVFVIVVIIKDILIARSVSQRNSGSRNH